MGTTPSDDVRAANIEVKAGEIIGWPGSDGTSEPTLHLEVFTKDNRFLTDKELKGFPKCLKIKKETPFYRNSNYREKVTVPQHAILELAMTGSVGTAFPTLNSRKLRAARIIEGWVRLDELQSGISAAELNQTEKPIFVGDEQCHLLPEDPDNPWRFAIGQSYKLAVGYLEKVWENCPTYEKAVNRQDKNSFFLLRREINDEPITVELLETKQLEDYKNGRYYPGVKLPSFVISPKKTITVGKIRYRQPPKICPRFEAWVKDKTGLSGYKYRENGKSTWHYLVTEELTEFYRKNPEMGYFEKKIALNYEQDLYVKESDCRRLKDADGNLWLGIPGSPLDEGQMMIYPNKDKDESLYWLKKEDSNGTLMSNISEVNPFSCFTPVELKELEEENRCFSPLSLLGQIDTNNNGRLERDEIEKAVKKSPTRFYLRLAACKHPSAWFLDAEKRNREKPASTPKDQFEAFEEVDNKMTFLHKVNGFKKGEELCHFHPIAFVEHLRRIIDSRPYTIPKYVVDHIPKTTPSNRRSGTIITPEYLTIHSTANTAPAKNERAYLASTSNLGESSFHIVVDEKEAIECIPLNEKAIHAYSQGNIKSIGLEITEGGDRTKTLENAIAIAAKVLRDKGWDSSKLKRHYDWPKVSNGYQKACPGILITPSKREKETQTWEWFKSQVENNI